MEVVTKVACCSVIAGGGGVTGAYGVYKISSAYDAEKEKNKPNESQGSETPPASQGDSSGTPGAGTPAAAK